MPVLSGPGPHSKRPARQSSSAAPAMMTVGTVSRRLRYRRRMIAGMSCRTNCQCSASPASGAAPLAAGRHEFLDLAGPPRRRSGLLPRRSRNRVVPGQWRSTSRPIPGYSTPQ